MESRPVEAELLHTDGHTDRQTDREAERHDRSNSRFPHSATVRKSGHFEKQWQ